MINTHTQAYEILYAVEYNSLQDNWIRNYKLLHGIIQGYTNKWLQSHQNN